MPSKDRSFAVARLENGASTIAGAQVRRGFSWQTTSYDQMLWMSDRSKGATYPPF